jgi:aspartate kinase
MSCVVLKFGGASVAGHERLHRVARAVAAAGPGPLVVVVSARQGRTDELIADMRALTPNPPPAALDVLQAVGELHSAALLAAAVSRAGRPAEVVPPWGVIGTDAVFGDATIRVVKVRPVRELLARGAVPVVPGFIGATADGRLTTLGRGGSDYTAVALGAALGAWRVELHKAEVDGVYDADPHAHPGARRYDALTHEEAVRLARAGAKVLHHKAAELALRYGVPVVVRAAFGDGPGTAIGVPGRARRAVAG